MGAACQFLLVVGQAFMMRLLGRRHKTVPPSTRDQPPLYRISDDVPGN